MNNSEMVREYRAALAAAEAVRFAQGLRADLLSLVASGEVSEELYLVACASGLDEIRERAGDDCRVHERRAKRLINQLVSSNVKLVEKIAKRTLGSRAAVRANVDEAVQEGSIGLVRAIENFDESRGAFSTCAGFWIRHHVQNCMHKQVDFAKQRPAMMPASVARACARFRTLKGREPEPHEVGATEEQWAKWLDGIHVNLIEDMVACNDPEFDGCVSRDILADEREQPDEVLSGMVLHQRLDEEMAAMSPRNRELTHALFIEGRTIQDVAADYDLSFQRIHQLKTVLEKRLRKVLAA